MSGTSVSNSGLAATSSTGQLTIAKEFRMYSGGDSLDEDPVEVTLEGRVDAYSAWVEIYDGNLPWINTSPGRNYVFSKLPIDSTYTSGDTRYFLTSLPLSNNVEDYRVFFTPRNTAASRISFADVEIPGLIVPQA